MSDPPSTAAALPRLWFGLMAPVSRRAYLLTGVGLMLVKYAVEAGVLWTTTGRSLTPVAFLSPFYSSRIDLLTDAPAWIGPAFYVWTLPFLWVALSMSIRRAADVGDSPWFGLAVLVPLVNYVAMAVLALAPTRSQLLSIPNPPRRRPAPAALDVLAVLFGPAYTLLMVGLVVHVLKGYGAVLFFLTPVLIGAVSAYLAAIANPDEAWRPFALAFASLVGSGLTLMLLALEGAICLAMAAPLVFGAGMVGATAGWMIARLAERPRPGMFVGMLALPLLATAEVKLGDRPPLRSVTTAVVVDAPPAAVWRQVVSFPDLTERPEWFFRAGIAAPVGATIDGAGVGAVRRCRFTTGEFVEPITVWDEPRRLGFDVASQPHPMAEVNPFGDPHPPHLDTALRSERGEFRLEPLPGGRTRLVGTTWYRLHMGPQEYWSGWTDAIIHRIHARVLRHVARLAETKAIK